jgi:tRNA threonylcarbamoyladenosine biosynthesis protein TsaB
MKILALDTSTEACSCALSVAGEITARFIVAPQQHSRLILPMIEELLAQAGLTPTQLDGLAFGRGPGSFTGLRIACGVVQGIAFAADLPVAPISCLAALAQAAHFEVDAQQVLAAMDARMGEVYWGIYRLDNEQIMQCEGKEQVSTASQIQLSQGLWYGIGSGWQAYSEILLDRYHEQIVNLASDKYPQARAMLPLALKAFTTGQTVSAENALPVYLRNRVV